MIANKDTIDSPGLTLVLGATGKTGRHIVKRLQSKGTQFRPGSRSGNPRFDWSDQSTWSPCLQGIRSVYLNYVPDLAVPGAADTIDAFLQACRGSQVEKIVLLSGRGEAEAQKCERLVQKSGLHWTIIRASWFFQNFSEGAFLDMVRSGQITLPVGKVLEPFIDAEDIADVAVAALTEPGHADQLYEVTGPRLCSFQDIADELTSAIGRRVEYTEISHEAFIEGVKSSGAPEQVVWLMDYLFSTVLDGRNSKLADGVQKALGREPKDFRNFAQETAAQDLW